MTEITAHKGLFNDVELHVDDTGGTGRPVVLIHGWPLSAESWSKQIPALSAAGYRVVAYDRRGFGRSDKPRSGYDYNTFASDLAAVLDTLDLRDVTLVGFSMGGGEVARYIANHGEDRVRSVVFAAAVPPYLAQTPDNPEGPLTQDLADEMEGGLRDDEATFYEGFTTQFFSVDGTLTVSEAERQEAITLAHQADHHAALKSMEAWATTDFRRDLEAVTVPALIIHGSGDGTVPFEGSGKRTHEQLAGSELVLIDDAPHGLNVSHTDEFNAALLAFLAK